MNKKYDLEDRFIDFAIRISEIFEELPNTKLATQIGSQIIRCGTAPALNYAEAQGAESSKDFIHKLKIVLKELRETLVCLKIVIRKPLINPTDRINHVMNENNELISIIATSIKTAKNNLIKS